MNFWLQIRKLLRIYYGRLWIWNDRIFASKKEIPELFVLRNPNSLHSTPHNSASQSFSLCVKWKPSIIGLPKSLKAAYANAKHRRPTSIHLFSKCLQSSFRKKIGGFGDRNVIANADAGAIGSNDNTSSSRKAERMLKVDGFYYHSHGDAHRHGGDGYVDDYIQVDPSPSSKAIRPGPIPHRTPLIPYIPRLSPPNNIRNLESNEKYPTRTCQLEQPLEI